MDLSVIIAARNEIFLKNTIEDILKNMRGSTDIIAILDGYWPYPGIVDKDNVHIIHHGKSIGQRAAVNEGVGFSKSKYILKCDAHCSFDEGFDVKIIKNVEPDWTVIPRMYNLHAFDWVCKQGHRTYQGPKKCGTCGSLDVEMDVVWKPRLSRRTDFAMFDKDLHFQYWRGYDKRPEAKGDIADVMCCVGACWMMERERYWKIGGMDEGHGSWGQMGVELSCKSWLSGGRQVVNKTTWFAHLFRTQGEFSFPYPMSGKDQDYAREYSRNLWNGNKWSGQKYPLSYLIKKFSPVPTWSD